MSFVQKRMLMSDAFVLCPQLHIIDEWNSSEGHAIARDLCQTLVHEARQEGSMSPPKE